MSRDLGWNRSAFSVAVGSGQERRLGYVNKKYPGLGMHRTPDLGWIITHLPSGAAMLAGCPTREYCEVAVRTLSRAADWTAPIGALRYRTDLFELARTFSVAWSRWANSGAKPLPANRERVS